jgi:hypothetical protein
LNLDVKEITRESKPLGLHLMECAGNSRFGHFGLLSVADWVGVPLLSVLQRDSSRNETLRIQISGFDSYRTKSATSIPGASWIFSWQDIYSSGAFLATGMNGKPLVADHGAPVRLVVPGWYGCTCIKWIDEMTTVDANAAATSQMQEYATRTHQKGIPTFARDYEPAMIDAAAMPIRVEKWVVNGRIKYRIVGIVWGGSGTVRSLNIQVNGQDHVPVEKMYTAERRSWAMWTHSWTPQKAGLYAIRLMIGDPRVRTRRLDSGFYTRTVQIAEV